MKIITDFKDYYDMASTDHSVLYIRKRTRYSWHKIPLSIQNVCKHRDVIFIGFCGEIYPLYQNADYMGKKLHMIRKSYNFEDLNFEDWILKSVKKVREEVKYVDFSNIFIENQTPIFVIDYMRGELVLNPCLKDYGFYTIFDPVQAYQEIEMYIGNVLLPKDKEFTPLTDKEKIISKGFDLKTSFRKDKDERTRKNKRNP